MKLPEPALTAVRRYFDAHHPTWHLARVRRNQLRPSEVPGWERAREMFPALKFRGDQGSGAEFLTFHREMMREYKWIIAQYPAPGLVYQPWSSIPNNVQQIIKDTFGGDVEGGQIKARSLAGSASLDELGSYIEPVPQRSAVKGAGLHDFSHGAVAVIEEDSVEPEFSMGSPATAHRNVVFYQLHGWIDELYANWQRAHGEVPDLSAKEPQGGHHVALLREGFDSDMMEQVGVAVARLQDFRNVNSAIA